jgi:hypothetical protein
MSDPTDENIARTTSRSLSSKLADYAERRIAEVPRFNRQSVPRGIIQTSA